MTSDLPPHGVTADGGSPGGVGSDPDRGRVDELAAGLARVRERVRRAALAAGRDPADVHVVAVTKTWPVPDLARLVRAGVRDLGENRDAEAAAKRTAIEDEPGLVDPGSPVRFHMVGQVQSRKAASVASWADVVHSVDRSKLVTALDRGAVRRGRTVGCLIQVDLSGPGTGPAGGPGRGGAPPEQLAALADSVEDASGLDLLGVMAVAPRGLPAGPAFERLGLLAEAVRRDHPGARWMSAGMSGDLEEAVTHGATHLRVGSAILGDRPPLR